MLAQNSQLADDIVAGTCVYTLQTNNGNTTVALELDLRF
jgi:hypothetical protein